MTEDLYDTLGIDRGADEPKIRAAYRRRAKQTHPDAGGTAEEFERLNRAKLVLLDPARRRKYDETGKVDDAPDDSTAKAMNVVVSALDEVLGLIERRHQDPLAFDLIADARRKVAEKIATGEQHCAQSRDTIAKLKKIIKRFSVKKGKVNRLGPLFEQRLKAAEDNLAQNLDIIASMKLAYDILGDHKFEFEAAAPQGAQGAQYYIANQARPFGSGTGSW